MEYCWDVIAISAGNVLQLFIIKGCEVAISCAEGKGKHYLFDQIENFQLMWCLVTVLQ